MASRSKKKRGQRDDDTAGRLRGPLPNPALAPAFRGEASLGVIVGGTPYRTRAGDLGWSLDIFDLDAASEQPTRIRMPFLPHGFSPHPERPHVAAVFEKRGPGAAMVDLVAGKVLSSIAPKPGHHFYGHGLHSAAGEVVFAVEMSLATSAGVITVRDAETFRVLEEFPSFGERPHDCMLLDEGRVLAVTNGGGRVGSKERGSVSFVSVSDRKLLDKREVASGALNAGHVAITRGGAVAVVSAPREGLAETDIGGVSLSGPGSKLAHMQHPADLARRLVGEALSVCVDERSGHVVVTHPYANLVTIWDLAERRLLRHFELESPRGVTLTADDRYFVLSHGAVAALVLLDTSTLDRVGTRGSGVAGGSHIYTWAFPRQPDVRSGPDTAASP
jgi:hypothetical protein